MVNVGDYFGYGSGLPVYPPGMTSLSSSTNSCQTSGKNYTTCWPLDWALVGMLDFTGCNAGTNLAGCALSSGSPYKDAGTDGMDIGANVAAVVAALAPIVW
jgi:hypothetical protein